MFFLVGRVLGKRKQGLFGPGPSSSGGAIGDEGLEFGYCFDVSHSSSFSTSYHATHHMDSARTFRD